MEPDLTLEQFSSIVENITMGKSLGFCDDKFPEEGKNYNLALNISVKCMNKSLAGVLVETHLALNVMTKSTFLKLSFKGTRLKGNNVIVRAFDESRKTVIGEVEVPTTIGPHTFQITFQVMDIQVAYSCLLDSWNRGSHFNTSSKTGVRAKR